MATITRTEFVEAAQQAVNNTDGLTNNQKHDLMKTARTVDRFLVRGWIYEDCGCLIGSTYPEEITQSNPGVKGKFPKHGPLYDCGMLFDRYARMSSVFSNEDLIAEDRDLLVPTVVKVTE